MNSRRTRFVSAALAVSAWRGRVRAREGRALALLAVLLLIVPPAFADGASRVPKPTVAVAAPGKCVEDTAYMLRNHMELLKHHRDSAVRDGVRTTQHSLANCVTCHASKETGRVTGSKDAFCEGCHRYAAVKLDCFECHADRPEAAAGADAAARVAGANP